MKNTKKEILRESCSCRENAADNAASLIIVGLLIIINSYIKFVDMWVLVGLVVLIKGIIKLFPNCCCGTR